MRQWIRLWLFMVVIVAADVSAETFKIGTVAQAGTEWMKVMTAAAANIKAETEGRVKFKFYGGGVMGNDSQVIRKIRIGQLQGGAMGTGVLARFYGDLELYNLPMIFRNYEEVDFIRNQFDDRISAGLEAAGFVNFGFAEGGFAYAMTKNKALSVDSMRHQKVWTPTDDASAQRAIEAFGISPIPLGIADVLLALQADTLNALAGPANAALALQWHTQVNYLLELPLIYTYAMLVLDAKRFNRLDSADQETTRRHMEAAFKKVDAFYRQDHAAALAALRNQGIEFLSPTPEETNIWHDTAKQATESIVASGLVTRALFEELKTKLDNYRRNSGG